MGQLLAALALVSYGLWPSAAQAELTRGDQAALLFSTQLRFDARNVPIVPIGVTDGVDEVKLSARAGVRVFLDGGEQAFVDLPQAPQMTARILDGTPAKLTYFAVVNRVRDANLAGVQSGRKTWEERQLTVRVFEVGSVFGFLGRVLDSRAVLIALDQPYATSEEAMEAAQVLAKSYPDAEPDVHAVLEQRPAGRVRLEVGSTVVEATDMLRLRALDGTPLTVHAVEHGRGFQWAAKADRSYHGELVIAPDRQGKVAVVNPVDAETILEGLVPAEIYPSAPAEALAAQAVVARGELLAKIGHRHLTDPYVICSDVHCQVYKGAGQEQPTTSKAVATTKGLMLFDNVGLVDAVYSSSCGGHTEANHYAWGLDPRASLAGVPDGPNKTPMNLQSDAEVASFLTSEAPAYCKQATKGAGNYRWQVRITQADLAGWLGTGDPVGKVRALVALERGRSGRIVRLRIEGERGNREVQGELRIRKLLGGLKSALFVVTPEGGSPDAPDAFVLRGGGFGHGVGLCQVGAIGAAEAGLQFRSILEHYYPGASVEPVY